MPVLSGSTRSALRRRLPLGVAALAVSVGALTACSGGGDATGSGGTTSAAAPTSSAAESPSDAAAPTSDAAQSQKLSATAVDFSFSLDRNDLAAGAYEIALVNDGAASHDLKVEQNGKQIGGSQVIPPGESTTFTIDLEPGEYIFYCSVGNHRAMGMEMAVTVT